MADSSSVIANANGTLSIFIHNAWALFIPTDGLTGFNRDNNTGYGNITVLENPDVFCNLSTCDLTLASYDYVPNLEGNALYAGIFGLYIFMNVYLGIRYRIWGYMVAMLLGLAGELVGYVFRIMLWQNPFDPTGNNFIGSIVSLTIAPAFISAGIYLCLARIVVIYGESLSRFRPRTYTLVFCGCDFVSLVIQGSGGGLAASANSPDEQQQGVNIILAGLSMQVASLVLFAAFCVDFAVRLRRNAGSWSTRHAAMYGSWRFKAFLCGLAAATVFIFLRSVYRLVELSGGFHDPLANNEVAFMVLEGAMLILAASCLTLLHPGIAFQGAWHQANFSFRTRSAVDIEKSPTPPGEVLQ